MGCFAALIILGVILAPIGTESSLPNLINSDIHKCIACLCHATTGCYSLRNCANYSISYDYWIKAKAPTVGSNAGSNRQLYTQCITDDNCIIHTIKKYTSEHIGNYDCVCDGIFDCRDMLSMHLYGEDCKPVMDKPYEYRYNRCARYKNLSQLNPDVECVNVDI